MSKTGIFGSHWSRLFCIVLVLVTCQFSLAQSSNQSTSVEEIVVTGDRPLRALHEEVILAEDAVFETFNEIYAGTDYEMICKWERPIKDPLNPIPNSHAVRACRSRLAHELYQQQMEEYAEYVYMEQNEFVGILPDSVTYQHRTAEHSEELFQKVRDLLVENPEYRDKFQDYATAKITYDAAVEADFANGNFITNFFSNIFGSDD